MMMIMIIMMMMIIIIIIIIIQVNTVVIYTFMILIVHLLVIIKYKTKHNLRTRFAVLDHAFLQMKCNSTLNINVTFPPDSKGYV
jgi:hypothetical protein